jgi:transposase
MGRPKKITEDREARYLEAIRKGNTQRAACSYAGFSEDTLARTRDSNADFADAIKKAEAEAEMRHVEIIDRAGTDSWQASAWWLERRHSSDWGKKLDVTSAQQPLKALIGVDVEQV